ncbi:hypothetical protein [Providencia sp. MGF014]|uniref:hypothetical protein n=1 Tax=Providencia sp. MGF014 TaxID=2565573 RepID=UPI00113CDFEC|nr:hypothetical protein [Providencia sp. MGF014]THB27325.1 hypothetical protein E6R27_08765 [Providencia sp. MGF014]
MKALKHILNSLNINDSYDANEAELTLLLESQEVGLQLISLNNDVIIHTFKIMQTKFAIVDTGTKRIVFRTA